MHGNEWLSIRTRDEVFSIKGQKDTVVTLRSTHHGPIISDVHNLLSKGDRVLSMSWTGHWVTNEMDAWVELTTMKNWGDFTNGVKKFGVPGQNIVYADVDGNIGWRPAVYIPIRKMGYSMVPRPGWDPAYDWKGRVPFEEMPFLLNPKKGFISTANNKTIDDSFPYYISGLWADPSRASRINGLLSTDKKMTLKDMKEIQLDLTSNFSKEILPHILDRGHTVNGAGAKRAIKFLRNWDHEESIDSEATLIFHSIVNEIINNIYKDELLLLGENYYKAYKGLKYITKRNLRSIIENGYSSWVDNINTKEHVETIVDIIDMSIHSGIDNVIKKFGPNWSNWKWGNAHSLTHRHILGDNKILNYLLSLNVGPFLSGGSDVTPNAGGYSLNKGFKQTSGASMRRIVDFSNLDETQMIIPTGQSGLNNSPNYNDQAALYHSGNYRTTRFHKHNIENDKAFMRLTLHP